MENVEGPGHVPPPKAAPGASPLRRAIDSVQTRVIGGLILALPVAITFWIIYWLYSTFRQYVLSPIVQVIRSLYGPRAREVMPAWVDQYVVPLLAIGLVLGVLYFLGLVARSRLHKALDWVMLRVPGVTTIYKAVSNLFQSIGSPGEGLRFKRVVLVEFPHPGIKALGLVTNTLRDQATGRSILCVCVLTGVVPPAGFTLFVPEESVIDVDWSLNDSLQAILSGGITAPGTIRFHVRADVPGTGRGAIIDPHGHPVEVRHDADNAPSS